MRHRLLRIALGQGSGTGDVVGGGAGGEGCRQKIKSAFWVQAGLSLSFPPSVSKITRLVTSESFCYNREHNGLWCAGQTPFVDASGTLCKCR